MLPAKLVRVSVCEGRFISCLILRSMGSVSALIKVQNILKMSSNVNLNELGINGETMLDCHVVTKGKCLRQQF